MTNKASMASLIPIFTSFFVMGFIDLVGVSIVNVKNDFLLSDKVANLLPTMTFIWFAFLSIPIGFLMNRLGQKRVVALSLLFNCIAFVLPLLHYSFPILLLGYTLLGVGNTLLQVSLNPFLNYNVPIERSASMLTAGQFIKAISSFIAPVLLSIILSVWGEWQYIFGFYLLVSLIAYLSLLFSSLPNPKQTNEVHSNIGGLLKNHVILPLFLSIVCIVGFEIALISSIPRYLATYFELPVADGALFCSLYYIARIVGTFVGIFLLTRLSGSRVLLLTVGLATLISLFFFSNHLWVVGATLFLEGLLCANAFSIILSIAINHYRSRSNEISSLMIMGVAGGAIVPFAMGVLSDITTLRISFSILTLLLGGILFLTSYAIILSKKKKI